MAENFLDVIADKQFAVADRDGYDRDDVDSFLDVILEEMERREAETAKIQAKVDELTNTLKTAKLTAIAPAAPAAKANDKHSAESFELVLSKAKGAYEEIVSEADARAADILAKANEEAASIRSNAEKQISDLTAKLDALRSQTATYYSSLKKIVDAQSASMDQLKKLL